MLDFVIAKTIAHPFLVLSLLPPFLLVTYLIINELLRYSARNRGFPGPPNRFLVGNLPDIVGNAPETFRKWVPKYGDVFEIQLGNIPILVINSAYAAKELFGHQSHALSSRPVFYTFHKILAKTAGSTIGTSPISPSLKRRRRAAASALNKPAVTSYAPHLDLETAALIKAILDKGDNGTKAIEHMPLIQRFALSIILTVNWGTRMSSQEDVLFREIIEVERGIVSLRARTSNFADYIPLLRLNPFTGTPSQAKDWRERRDVYLARFDSELKQRMDAGTHSHCIQANAMLDPEVKLSKDELTSISISVLQGGTGTVSGTVNWAIAFLSQHREIQGRAFEDINAHYAGLLTADDHEQRSPYLEILVKEFLRYFTVLRLRLPRETITPITFRGRKIKQGSTIWLNAWACNMDPEVWKDPLKFRPERWDEKPDAPLFTYGLGYRMCAGNHLANAELYLLFLRLIGCFEIVPEGEMDVDPVRGSGELDEAGRNPGQYKVLFRPRDEKALREALVEKEAKYGQF